jgi:hypothetical protein
MVPFVVWYFVVITENSFGSFHCNNLQRRCMLTSEKVENGIIELDG